MMPKREIKNAIFDEIQKRAKEIRIKEEERLNKKYASDVKEFKRLKAELERIEKKFVKKNLHIVYDKVAIGYDHKLSKVIHAPMTKVELAYAQLILNNNFTNLSQRIKDVVDKIMRELEE